MYFHTLFANFCLFGSRKIFLSYFILLLFVSNEDSPLNDLLPHILLFLNLLLAIALPLPPSLPTPTFLPVLFLRLLRPSPQPEQPGASDPVCCKGVISVLYLDSSKVSLFVQWFLLRVPGRHVSHWQIVPGNSWRNGWLSYLSDTCNLMLVESYVPLDLI